VSGRVGLLVMRVRVAAFITRPQRLGLPDNTSSEIQRSPKVSSSETESPLNDPNNKTRV
jgi:hypothetical protein